MNYVYDILLNFNEIGYYFYDWNGNDNILHIRKIPIFKIDSKTLKKVIHKVLLRKRCLDMNKNYLLKLPSNRGKIIFEDKFFSEVQEYYTYSKRQGKI